MLTTLKETAARLKRETRVYRLILDHPGTPRRARWLLGCALAYAASPIDLIPDFIPVIGHLDDLLIVPSLILLARRSIPANVIEECRIKALAMETRSDGNSSSPPDRVRPN